MCFEGMSYLPVVMVLMTITTFIITYIFAMAETDVIAVFPYISDTGTKPPESCVFGQLLNIAAALAVCTIYVRYKLVRHMLEQDGEDSCRRLNQFSLFIGIISGLGLSMVANFQETNVEPVHVVGAGFVFIAGVIYAFMQTRISYKMHPRYNGITICRWRLLFSILSLVSLISTIVSAGLSRIYGHPQDRLHWKPSEDDLSISGTTTVESSSLGYPLLTNIDKPKHLNDLEGWLKGYAAHIVSTVSEWLTAIIFLFFFFTFIRDFQKIRLEIHSHVSVRHLDDDPCVYDDTEPNERTPLRS